MEPISILTSVSGASRAALALSTTLFSFVQATRNIDQNVRSLYDEVTGLSRTIDAISSSLRTADIETPKQTQRNHDLWRSVDASLGDCRVVLDSMHKTLQSVKKTGSNVAAQMLRAFKLNWKEDEIKTLRSQIQSQNAALQLALQAINVHLTSIAPHIVIDDLVPRFEILTDMIMQLSLSKTSDKPQEDPQSSGTISVPKRPPSLTNLVFSAKDVLDQARSTIEQSEEGSDDSSTITVMLHHLDLLEQDLQSNLAMHSGGQWSRPRTEPEHHEFVQNWVSSAPMGANTGRSDSTSTIGGDSPSFDEDSDEDDDLDYEILQEFLKRGFANYEKGDWANAELYIRRAIDSSKTLPLDKVRLKGIDLEAAQFQIAICAFHQKRFDEADVETLELRTARPASNEPKNTTLRRILSVYLFAEICFERKKLEDAHKCCRKARSMRRKLLGETVWLETNCFTLLSAIAAAQGDNLTAEVYRDKARASTTADSPLKLEQEQESEIRSARLDSIIRTWDGIAPTQPRPEVPIFNDPSEYNIYVTRECQHRAVVVYFYSTVFSQVPEHEELAKQFADYAAAFSKAIFIHLKSSIQAHPLFYLNLKDVGLTFGTGVRGITRQDMLELYEALKKYAR